jgi:predicted MFS family arabinose efflux permease
VPVSIAVIAVGAAQLPSGGRLQLPNRDWVVETVLLGSATAALMLSLSQTASHGPGWLVLAITAVPPITAWLRMGSSRTVRGLLGAPDVAGPHIGLVCVSAGAGLILFVLPFYMHRELQVSPSVIGLTMLAFPAMNALVGLTAGAMADWWGARRTAISGAAVLAAGLLLLAPLGPDWGPTDLAWRLAIVGIGVGLFNAPNMTMALSNSPRELLGTTGASTSVARQLGFATGPAIATAIWAASGYTIGGISAVIALASGLAVASGATLVLLRQPRSQTEPTPAPAIQGARS